MDPIKCLNEISLQYKSFLRNTILLIFTFSRPIGLSFLWNAFLLIQCLPKIKAFYSILIESKEK